MVFRPTPCTRWRRDRGGVMWAGTMAGVYVQRGRKWFALGEQDGLPLQPANSLLIDRTGTVWVAFDRVGVYTRTAGASRFSRLPNTVVSSAIGLTETPAGEVWAAAENGAVIRLSVGVSGLQTRVAQEHSDLTGTIFSDENSNLWFGTMTGVGRVSLEPRARSARAAPVVERFTQRDGLSGNLSVAVLADREGNIWVGTEGGLDRFRTTKLTALDLPPHYYAPAIVAEDRGAFLVGNVYRPVVRMAPFTQPVGLGMAEVQAVYQSADGTRWLGNESGQLWHSEARSFVRDVVPDGIAGLPIQAIAREASGALWLSVVKGGVFRRSENRWSTRDVGDALPHATALTISIDSADGVWLGYTANRLAHYENAKIRVFTEADGVNVGNVTAIFPSHGKLWIGGESGLMRFARGKFSPLEGKSDVYFRGITGIVERPNGDLWLNGAEGITAVDAAELARAAADSNYRVNFQRLDSRDGLDGVAPQLRPLPSAVVGSDGMLLFTTSTNAYRVDPDHLPQNTIVPPVHIRQLLAAGVRYAPSDTTLLPANTREIQIRYTALSLGISDRVQFRYRLVGSDSDWHDAGTRREAFYTNLGPGTYQFRVIASNDDGVWNENGATIFVSIPPTFAQTPTFFLLSTLAILLLVWYAYHPRVGTVSRRLRERYDTRTAERTRISQELHDTLLQGFTGITLQLQSVRRGLAVRDTDAAEMLEGILTEADVALREARYAVWDLRPPELESADMVDAVVAFAQSSTAGLTIDLRWTVSGNRRRLAPEVETAALRIARECITNVIRHSGADLLMLHFQFDPQQFVMRLTDDGCGINMTNANSASRRGHWGIAGMKDRATRVRGHVTIAERDGGGTEICATFPDSRS